MGVYDYHGRLHQFLGSRRLSGMDGYVHMGHWLELMVKKG